MTKQKFPQIGIRWKLVAYLAVFISILLLVLWLFQIVFLGDIYRNIKVNEIFTAADTIKSRITTTNPAGNAMAQLTDSIASDSQICVLVLDDSFRAVGRGTHNTCYSIGAEGSCFVHQSSNSMLSDMIRIQFLATVRQSGEVYFRDMSPKTSQQPTAALGGTRLPTASQNTNPDRETAMLYVDYFEHGDNGYYVILNSKVTPVSSTVQTLQYELVIISILFIVAAVIMALILSARISAPIIKINERARQLATGDYNTVFEGSGYKEIAELRDTLNYAARELSKVEGFRRELIANVSHDLRTPLTTIIGFSDSYLEDDANMTEEEKRELVTQISDDSHWLLNMVENLLSVTRIHNETAKVNKSLEAVDEVVASSVARFKKRFPGAEVKVKVPDDFIMVMMDAMLIEQVIINILQNAQMHANSRKPQEVIVEDKEDRVVFRLRDYGDGIDESRMTTIFDGEGYHADSDRQQDSYKGMGIGLSICQTIILAHGGKLSALNHSEGAEFRFTLPKEKEEL